MNSAPQVITKMSSPTSATKTTPTSDTPSWCTYEVIRGWSDARKAKEKGPAVSLEMQGAKAAEATQSKLSSGIANA